MRARGAEQPPELLASIVARNTESVRDVILFPAGSLHRSNACQCIMAFTVGKSSVFVTATDSVINR